LVVVTGREQLTELAEAWERGGRHIAGSAATIVLVAQEPDANKRIRADRPHHGPRRMRSDVRFCMPMSGRLVVWLRAQFHPWETNWLWHVLHVVAGSEFVFKLQDELLAGGYKPLGVVFRIESTRRRPTRQRGLEIGLPLREVRAQAIAESQSLWINLDVAGARRLRERRSSPSGHQLDPASRCWPIQQLSRSRDYIGLDLLTVLG
jgi:hypothetical protein